MKYLIRMIDFDFVLTIHIGHHSIITSFHHHTDTYHRFAGTIRNLSCHVSGSSPLCRFCVFLPDILGDTDSFVIDIERDILPPKQIIQYIFDLLLFGSLLKLFFLYQYPGVRRTNV